MDTIDAPEADYLYLGLSQLHLAGKGLFTATTIYKGEIFAFFRGELITRVEAKMRATNHRDKYFITMHNGSTLDCMHTTCFAKYANDAKGYPHATYKNNASIILDDSGKVCLCATRKIKPYEEIFCSYGYKYWDKHR